MKLSRRTFIKAGAGFCVAPMAFLSNPLPSSKVVDIKYDPLPAMREFHRSNAPFRRITGTLRTGKTTAAIWEIAYFLPMYLHEQLGIEKTRWGIIRNDWQGLMATRDTFLAWFPPAGSGDYRSELRIDRNEYRLLYNDGTEVEVLFLVRNTRKGVSQLINLELTGCLLEQSNEITERVKQYAKCRIGRFPRMYYENGGNGFYIETMYKPEGINFSTLEQNNETGYWEDQCSRS